MWHINFRHGLQWSWQLCYQDISPLVDEKSAEKAEHAFKCLICDFTSNWENQLQIHMTRKPNTIEQIDGNSTFDSEEIDDDKK